MTFVIIEILSKKVHTYTNFVYPCNKLISTYFPS
jgi:hypothetical protein